MTDQEFYNKTLDHLHKQGHRSEDAFGRCMYRGPNGDKCAMGIHITDEEYLPGMEGRSISGVLRKFQDRFQDADQRFRSRIKLASSLQHLHDVPRYWSARGAMTEHGRKYAALIAKLNNLVAYVWPED
jgi:hypothetical protein